jgi:diguanylate cyclase (GGDEF)-like protein
VNSAPSDLAGLIGRVMPLERLPRRARATRPLRRSAIEPLERAARVAIDRLGGVALEAPATEVASQPAPAAAPPGAASVPAPEASPTIASDPALDGIVTVARAGLPEHASVATGQIRRLLRLGDPMLASDPRRGEARADLLRHLERATQEVLGSVSLRLVTADAVESDAVARAAQAHPEMVLCAEGGAAGRTRAWLGLVSARGEPLGVLDVAGLRDCEEDELALVALLGDYAAGVLERAARVENLVFVDPMTGAYNRSYFEIQMQNEMARAERDASGMAVCIVDIDDFKSFNTRYGYEGGNQVLIRVAQALKNGVRPFDTVARWGGEEFAVLLSAPVQAQDVVTVAERLRGLVERMRVAVADFDGTMRELKVTVSIGAGLFPDHGGDHATLWRTANVALLAAKQPPKNRVVFGGR